jgi:hypothetical protein
MLKSRTQAQQLVKDFVELRAQKRDREVENRITELSLGELQIAYKELLAMYIDVYVAHLNS